MATKQFIISGTSDDPATSGTEYSTLMGNGRTAWLAAERDQESIIPVAGTLTNFQVGVVVAPDTGKSWVFIIRKAASGDAMGDTALSVTISDTAVLSSLDASEVAVVAGDRVTISATGSGTPDAATAVHWTCQFTPDTDGETILLGNNEGRAISTNRYYPLVGSDVDDSSESDVYTLFPTAGTIKKFYVELENAPGNGDSRIFTVRKGGVGQSLAVTISGGDITGNDVDGGHDIDIAAGDVLTIQNTITGAPTSSAVAFGIVFLPDTQGEFITCATADDSLNTGTNEYQHLSCGDAIYTATETEQQCLAQETTAKKLYINLSAAPGNGKSFVFTLRRNASVTTGLAVTISGAVDTTGNDATDVAISADDLLATLIAPSGTPTAVKARMAYLFATAAAAPQELTAAAVAVTSSIASSTISGSGDAPLTAVAVAETSSVVTAVIAGTGAAPLTGTVISVTSSVQAATIRTSVTILTAAVVSVTSSVQNASIAGTGIAPLTGTVVSAASSVQQAIVNTTQVLTAAVISVTSSVQAAVISGSGDAPLTGTVIGVASSVQNSAIAGSGIAPLTGTVIAVTSSVVASDIGFIMQAAPIPVTSSVVTAAISGSGNAPLTQASVAVTSSVQAAAISGSGIAPLTGSSVAATSAVQTASIAGVGTAPLTGAIVAATSSVQSASISGTGISPLTAAVVNVLASVAAASISGSGTVNLTEAAIVVSATVNRALIAGTGVANLTAGYVSVVTSVVSGQAELLWQVLFASPLAVVTSVVGSNVDLSWILVCEDLGIDPSSLEPTSIPISRLEIMQVPSSRQPLCRPKRRYT